MSSSTVSLAFLRWRQVLAKGCLAVLCACQLLSLYGVLASAASFSAFALLSFSLFAWHNFARRERLLLVASLCLSATTVFYLPTASDVLLPAAHKAAFLASFMLLLATLREGAMGSSSVASLGHWVATRPPGKRYLSISTGAQFLGLLLNFGALNLLGPLLLEGSKRHGNIEVREWRLRRQFTALGQSFSWLIAWSPTAVTGATAAAVVSGSNALYISFAGIVAAVGAITIGWANDRRLGDKIRHQLGAVTIPVDGESTELPRRSAWRFGGLCILLVATSFLLTVVFSVGLIPALMLCSPVVSIVWLMVQRRGDLNGDVPLVASPPSRILSGMLNGAPDAIVLACGGYLGLVMAGLVDTAWLAAQFSLQAWPSVLIYWAVMAVIPCLSTLAIPPILSVTFIGSVLSAAALPALQPNLLAVSLVIGWVLNLNGSPFGIGTLILSRISERHPRVIAWRWNGVLCIQVWVFCCLFVAALASV